MNKGRRHKQDLDFAGLLKKTKGQLTPVRGRLPPGLGASSYRARRGLVSSSIVLRFFFDCSSFSKRNTIEEQSKNKQASNESTARPRQRGGCGVAKGRLSSTRGRGGSRDGCEGGCWRQRGGLRGWRRGQRRWSRCPTWRHRMRRGRGGRP